MAQTDTRSTTELFKSWRGGDGGAGQLMAQRFADWYYAISTSRLGESSGRGACESACSRFGQGIVQVTEARALVSWAHDIIADELSRSGSRAVDGDEPNAYTGNQNPKTLLVKARAALPQEVAILEGVYGGRLSAAEIDRLTEPLGGNPIGVLRARYQVKRWLRDNLRVPFEVVPETPILDRAPLPLYESGRMAAPAEEVNFEHWMLTDLDLCKDIAEFAHFAIALRGGVPATLVEKPKPQADQRSRAAESAPEATSGGGVGAAGAAAAGGVALLAVGGFVALVVIAGVVAYFVM